MLIAFGAGRIIEMKNVEPRDYHLIQEMMQNNYESSKLDCINVVDSSKPFLSEKHLTYLCYTCFDKTCPMCLVANFG